MFEARYRLKRVLTPSRHIYRAAALVLAVAALGLAPSPGAVSVGRLQPTRVQLADVARHSREVHRPRIAPASSPTPATTLSAPHPASTELLSFTSTPTATQHYVVALIHRHFPHTAWRDAEIVAWCESKFRPTDIGFDSNGTHDRGVFQLNDGGTEQYLLSMLGHNPKDLALAFNPVINVQLAALLYSRDGWSPWSCASDIPA